MQCQLQMSVRTNRDKRTAEFRTAKSELEDNYIRLQEDIDKIDIDCVGVVTDDDDDIILIEQKGKEMGKEIKLIMETVWKDNGTFRLLTGKRDLINGSGMEQIVDMFRKQLSELKKKHRILQERLEELKQAAFKKEESFSDRQELAKSEDELQPVKVRNLGEKHVK